MILDASPTAAFSTAPTTPGVATRVAIRDYFAQTASPDSPEFTWRMSCYDVGRELTRYVEREHFSLQEKRVLDVAAGWGGHLLAFAERGASTVATDLNDHHFERLGEFARQQGLDVRTEVAPCERVPLPDGSFDVILALELIEHLESVPAFAREVARLLAPGGIAVLSTPARLKCVLVDEEPHYHLRWLAILPFRAQGPIARRVFRRSYPFPITRQYLRASSALRPFRRLGLKGSVRWTGRLAERFHRTPILGALGRELLFNQLIVQRSYAAPHIPRDHMTRVDAIGTMLPVETITCGACSPDPDTERTLARLRAAEGYPADTASCGKPGKWTSMYRCLDCGRFMHHTCLQRHLSGRHAVSPEA